MNNCVSRHRIPVHKSSKLILVILVEFRSAVCVSTDVSKRINKAILSLTHHSQLHEGELRSIQHKKVWEVIAGGVPEDISFDRTGSWVTGA